MSKVDDFLTMLCRDFDFSHGGMEDKRGIVERLLALADLQIVPIGKPSAKCPTCIARRATKAAAMKRYRKKVKR